MKAQKIRVQIKDKIRDEIYYLELTEKQFDFLEWLDGVGILHTDDVDYEVIGDDIVWKEI